MIQKIKDIIQASADVKKDILANELLLTSLMQSAICIQTALQNGNRIYLCGNGGSAADAQHIAAELTGRFYKERPALAAEALHCNTSYLTAVANDYGYDHVYERYILGIGQAGDILIGLSTSGNSKNVMLAMAAAHSRKMTCIGLTGKNGGQMKSASDYWIGVPSDITPRIQESHILIGHILCELIEDALYE
ncbi:MAG: D-sedoheptulose 7-phosphate isomerase [Saprospiraceae bacterium]|nr:D-sedoheptulose 7-phosphate isomerase [Saprospiraceae bacterium]